MEIMDPSARERVALERDKKAKEWGFYATFVHDPELPGASWFVDGAKQEEPLTEEALRKAVFHRSGVKRVEVAVSAPLHVEIAKWIGWHPPYGPSGRVCTCDGQLPLTGDYGAYTTAGCPQHG